MDSWAAHGSNVTGRTERMLERLRGAPGAGLGVGAIPSSWFAEQVRAGSSWFAELVDWFELVRAGSSWLELVRTTHTP